jgi:hypothetical protein
MNKRLFSVALPVAGLLGLAIASAAQVVMNAPAFSPSLRADSVLGDWRVAGADALYNKSDYYFQLGFGYLQADTASLILGEDDLPTLEAFDAQMARSQELLRQSLASSPGRVDTWTSLAWAALLRDDAEAAESALRQSWQLAPFNEAEASERVALVSALDDFFGTDWHDVGSETGVGQDWAVLEAHDRQYLDALPDDLQLLLE